MTGELSFEEVKKTIFKVPVHQMLVGVVVALLFLFLAGGKDAFAAFFGAVISTVASLVFALVVFYSPSREAQEVKSRMIKGELYKVTIVAVLFYVAAVLLQLPLLPLLAGFIATFLTFWVVLLTGFK